MCSGKKHGSVARWLTKTMMVFAAAVVACMLVGVAPDVASAATKPTITVARANTGKVTIKQGTSYKLSAKASAGKLTYKSSKPQVVSVSRKGVVKGLKTGSVTITIMAKSGSSKAVKKVRISVVTAKKYKQVKKLTAKAGTVTLGVGGTTKVGVTFTPKNASNKNVLYRSSAPAVASVSATGVITARKTGTAKIVVTSCANAKAKTSVTITVVDPSESGSSDESDPDSQQDPDPDLPVVTAESVSLNLSEAEIEEGQAVTLAASIQPAEAADEALTWSTSDEGVASVECGVVTGTGPGVAVITATVASGASADCIVQVNMAGTAAYDQMVRDYSEMVSEYGWDEETWKSGQVPDDPYYTGRLIIKGETAEADFSTLDPQPVAMLNDGEGVTFAQFATSEDAKTAAEALAGMGQVSWVAVDEYVEVVEASAGQPDEDDPPLTAASSLSWGTEAIGADSFARSIAGTKGEVVVAVIDSGVDASHPFLSGRIARGGYDFLHDDSDPSDDAATGGYQPGHGTTVAGIIVDATPGLKNIKVLPIKVTGNGGGWFSISKLEQAIKYAVRHGSKVINLSLTVGFPRFGNPVTDAIDYAASNGVTVVVSSGNDYGNTKDFNPPCSSTAVVVGAINQSMTRADFSNVGTTVDFVAPGVSIFCCMPGGAYTWVDGTSQAAPYVSAAAAMVKLKHPQYYPSEIENTLRGCARDLGAQGRDNEYGYGMPDLTKISGSASMPTPTGMLSTVSPQPGLDAYSWKQLKIIADAIAAASDDVAGLEIAKTYHLVDSDGKLRGATKSVTFTDGTVSSVRIAGFRHDRLVSGGSSGITFEFSDVPYTHIMKYDHTKISDEYPDIEMIDSNAGGWEASDMRRWLNKDFYNLLPSELRGCIAWVSKSTNNTGGIYEDNPAVVTLTSDRVWLLSMVEIYGKLSNQTYDVPAYTSVYDCEGTQYKLYADQGVTTAEHGFCAKGGTHSEWCPRSPNVDGADNYHVILADGSWRYSGGSSFTFGVSPGFCF